jgi:hypothetical protein
VIHSLHHRPRTCLGLDNRHRLVRHVARRPRKRRGSFLELVFMRNVSDSAFRAGLLEKNKSSSRSTQAGSTHHRRTEHGTTVLDTARQRPTAPTKAAHSGNYLGSRCCKRGQGTLSAPSGPVRMRCSAFFTTSSTSGWPSFGGQAAAHVHQLGTRRRFGSSACFAHCN